MYGLEIIRRAFGLAGLQLKINTFIWANEVFEPVRSTGVRRTECLLEYCRSAHEAEVVILCIYVFMCVCQSKWVWVCIHASLYV